MVLNITLWGKDPLETSMGEVPEDFIRRYREILTEDSLEKLLQYLFLPLRKSIRTNTLKISPEKLRGILESKGYTINEIPWAKEGFWIEGEGIGKEIEHMMGFYYIQDASSMVPPKVLSPQRKDVVLDMASAPGGKATHISALMRGEGILVANEPLLYREKVLVGNIERIGVRNSAISLLRGNSFGWRFPNFFDRVLLDAPCSAEGSTRKDKEYFKKLWNLSYIKRAQNVQKALIASAIHALKPGGLLLYSTCTMSPEENEEILDYALRIFSSKIEFLEIGLPGLKKMGGIRKFEGKDYPGEVCKIARIWPFLNDSESFTLFLLKKKDETFTSSTRKGKVPEGRNIGKEIDRGLRARLVEFFRPYGETEFFKEERFVISGKHIWYQPKKFLPLFKRAVFNRAGVKVAKLHSTQDLRPTHAFLLAFAEIFTELKRELNEEEALKYAVGENLPDSDKYTRELIPLFFRGHPIGWGKKNEEMLLNRLPTPLVLR